MDGGRRNKKGGIPVFIEIKDIESNFNQVYNNFNKYSGIIVTDYKIRYTAIFTNETRLNGETIIPRRTFEEMTIRDVRNKIKADLYKGIKGESNE